MRIPILKPLLTLLCLVSVSLVGVAFGQDSDHSSNAPLTAAMDYGVAPFGFLTASGDRSGFGVDLANEIAERLGRPSADVVDVQFSGIFPGLFAKRYELIITPLNITQERSESMLFSEGYFATGNGFLIREDAEMNSLEDLSGKVIAVNSGTISDTWATENADRYGFEVQRYGKFPDTVQAVITGRAFAVINEIPTVTYAASQNDQVKVGFSDYTGRSFGLAFRLDDEEFRHQVEDVLECLKLDGTLFAIYEKWFGEAPNMSTNIGAVYAGYGPPGFNGYEPEFHVPSCEVQN